jgi:hypothetical protein
VVIVDTMQTREISASSGGEIWCRRVFLAQANSLKGVLIYKKERVIDIG